jgi:hypothetical protein
VLLAARQCVCGLGIDTVEVWGSSPHEPTIPTFRVRMTLPLFILQSLSSRPFRLVHANISIVVSKNVAGNVLRHAVAVPLRSRSISRNSSLWLRRAKLTVGHQFNSSASGAQGTQFAAASRIQFDLLQAARYYRTIDPS